MLKKQNGVYVFSLLVKKSKFAFKVGTLDTYNFFCLFIKLVCNFGLNQGNFHIANKEMMKFVTISKQPR